MRRLISLVFVLLGVTILVFAVSMLFPPSDRAMLYIDRIQDVPGENRITNGQIQVVIQKHGLNGPFIFQYWGWLSTVLQGNLGWSLTGNAPVSASIAKYWPLTFEIVMFAAPLIIFVGIYLGVQSAIHKDTVIDHASRVLSVVGWSLPSFLLGMILLAIFFGVLGWFPPGALSQTNLSVVYSSAFHQYTGIPLIDALLNHQWSMAVDALRHVVLPVVVIVTINVALLMRVMRSSMLESLSKPYIAAAKAKGLSKKMVIYKHARRNALIPVATLSGMMVAGLLSGLVITETVFSFGGLGEWVARAALQLDIVSVLGYAILSALLFVFANLIVDVLYAYIDPRIRLD